MKTMKQISLIIVLSIILMMLVIAFLFVTTGSVLVIESMIAYMIIDVYAICRGWHKIIWKKLIENKPLTEEEEAKFI